jgi:hypothetical protein
MLSVFLLQNPSLAYEVLFASQHHMKNRTTTLQGSTALTSLTFNGGAVYSESPLFAAGNIIQYNSASPAGYGGGVELAGDASIICGPFNVSSNSAVSISWKRPPDRKTTL